MKTLLAIILFGLAFKASGNCPVKKPGEVPVIPNGASVTDEQMYKARMEAEKFMLQAEAYMDCHVMNHRQHQLLAAQLGILSERLNNEVIKYQVDRQILAQE